MSKKLLAAALIPFAALAQDPSIINNEVTVVIGRTESTPLNIAANVDVIESSDIKISGAKNLTDLLRGRSGIQISDSNSGAVISMRGFSASQASSNTLIMIDGRRLNNIDISAPSISAIPLNQIERIEILNGSAGVLYGDQAVGGVINIITKAPDSAGGNVQLSGGSFNTYEGQANISAAINDKWNVYLSGSYNEGDNYREHNANKTSSILARLQYKTELNSFFIESSYYDNYREMAGSLTKEQFENDPRQATSTTDESREMTSTVRVGYQHKFNSNWIFDANLNFKDTLNKNIAWGSPREKNISLLEFNSKAIGNMTTSRGDLNIVTGIDLSRGDVEFDSGRENVQSMASIFTQVTAPLSEQLSYILGGRYSIVQDDLIDGRVYPNGVELDEDAYALELGLNYQLTINHRLYMRVDDNFRFSKVDEEAYTSPSVIGLKPQTGRSYEAGWDWNPKSHSISLNVFRLDLEDEIVFDSSAPKPINGQFNGANVNAEASTRYGSSINWNWQVNSDLNTGLEYSYIDAEFTEGDNKGKSLPWVAEHTARGYAGIYFADNFQLFVEEIYVGERYLNSDNSNSKDQLDDYLLSNVALNYVLNDWSVSLRADNLFDTKYASSAIAGWQDGYYVGNGRSVRLTANYDF
ncbi:TonB-dependent receptor [Moritella sp.]|uniref:TonB-dependent receptor family protein n=1 Tax=Moritella sp. TaxID=78556 RepID=UPI001D3BD07A|nr:TonB-dependent receptor [Moritella sp.]MCJ8352231.1 TonB-dependent receptor [Moritella sp.]NQZ42502.1 TonB-dependent receptor [Moritella sp.]